VLFNLLISDQIKNFYRGGIYKYNALGVKKTHTNLCRKSDRKRPFGRQKRRRDGNVKI